MTLRRLRGMGAGELVVRSRQELFKRLERIGAIGSLRARRGPVLTCAPRGRAPARTGVLPAAARFFEGAAHSQVAALLERRMPDAREQIVAAADRACLSSPRFDLLGYRGLSFGTPVDWHLDPISGRRAPLVHWSRLDPLDASTAGDCKVVWELNRHQWLVRLGQAYQLTRDERYVEVFARYITGWFRANPRGMGINWTSSLELALRLIAWCWTLSLVGTSRALSLDLCHDMLDAIEAQAAHVERHLSYYFSPNTHLTGEALGLCYAGMLFPQLGKARRWRRLGARILTEESERQILPDGVYVEQSTCYQRYTVEIYLHFLILAGRNNVAVAPPVVDRVQRMLDVLLAIRAPDGSIPQIGDADGGSLLPLADREPNDFRGLFAIAAAAFGRPDYAWAAGELAPELLWLLGPAGLESFEALRRDPPPAASSRLFPTGGYAVMRSGWDARAHQAIVDVGPLGCPATAGHGHADLVGIQLSVFGAPYVVDPGTYCYGVAPEWRDFFRGTRAHSTVVVDGRDQATPTGPFRWDSRPRARVRQWMSNDAFDFLDAEHDAYRRLPDPVRHRRRVLFVKPRYFVIVDDLDGAAEHRAEVRFQFAPLPVSIDSTGWARAQGPAGHGLLLRSFATVPLTLEVIEGKLDPIEGWVSPDYGQRRPAPAVVCAIVSRLPLRIVTLILPLEDGLSPPPPITPLIGADSTLIGLRFTESSESVHFDGSDAVAIRPCSAGGAGA